MSAFVGRSVIPRIFSHWRRVQKSDRNVWGDLLIYKIFDFKQFNCSILFAHHLSALSVLIDIYLYLIVFFLVEPFSNSILNNE